MDLKKLEQQYKNELLDNIIPFWLDKSQDEEYGGDISRVSIAKAMCSTPTNSCGCKDGRYGCLPPLYNQVEKRQKWLDCAIGGSRIFEKTRSRWQLQLVFFPYTRRKTTNRTPTTFFPHMFVVMGFGELSFATGNNEYADHCQKNIQRHPLTNG